jgi:hypothetical protein
VSKGCSGLLIGTLSYDELVLSGSCGIAEDEDIELILTRLPFERFESRRQ